MNQPSSHTAPAAPSGALSTVLAYLALALLALAAYWPSLGYGFLSLDDPMYTLGNPYVRDGFVDGSLGYAFGFDFSNWHPLTWLSLMLHAEVFGMTPLGLRIENLVLHAGCAALVFLSLRAMTRRFWPSLLVAALFVVHPVNVENVAWIAEHKTLLASFFGFAAIYCHVLYVHRPNLWRYVAVSVCAMLSLLSKATFVALPFLLLLLDAWPLGRFAPGKPVLPRLGRLTLEKTPLLLMTAGLCAVYIVIAQTDTTSAATIFYPGMGLRVANALVTHVRYLAHLAWPSGLSFFYPFPTSIPAWQTCASALALTAVTVLALRARSRPWLAVGWLWFLAAMLPTSGILQTGFWPAMADRYLYLPSVGIYIMAAFGLAEAATLRPRLRPMMAVCSGVVLAALLAATLATLPHWQSKKALAAQGLAATTDNWFAQNLMGSALMDEGHPELAEPHLRRALEIRPGAPEPQIFLATVLTWLGRQQEAVPWLKKALAQKRLHKEVRFRLLVMLEHASRPDLVLKHLPAMLEAAPVSADHLTRLIDGHLAREEWPEAAVVLRMLLRLKPYEPNSHNNLGVCLYRLERYQEAEEQFRLALALNESWADPRVHLAGALFRQGRYDEAEAEVRRALATAPDHPGALKLLPMIVKARP